MKDKNTDEMLKLLNNQFDKIYVTQINYERSATIDDLQLVCEKLKIKAESIYDPINFIEDFRNGDQRDCLVVLGSMYLLGEIKTGLEE